VGPRGLGEAKRLAKFFATLCLAVVALAARKQEMRTMEPQIPEKDAELAKQVISRAQHLESCSLPSWKANKAGRQEPATQADSGVSDRPTITRPTPKNVAGMKVLDVIKRAVVCCEGIPKREVSERTAKAYRLTFKRMLMEPVLDPLKESIARDTYNHRRASLHFASRYLLMALIDGCKRAAERNEPATVQRRAAELHRALHRIEPALALDPPCPPGVSTWDMPRSRWQALDTPRPRRRKHSKKHVLKRLPKDWTDRLWNDVRADWPHACPLAVHLLAPSRPEDLVPGARPHGWSTGAQIRLVSPRLLEIIIAPVKTHGGKYGSPTATTQWDPIAEGGAAAYLAELCAVAGGRIVVSISSKNAMRKSLARLGRRALPELKHVVITPYVIRNQVLADIKATVGAGEETASAAGHCTDRMQSHYGRVEHGRKRKGFLGATSSRKPRASNVARAKELAAQRRERALSSARPEEEEMVTPTI
jgi:hypothetical protein